MFVVSNVSEWERSYLSAWTRLLQNVERLAEEESHSRRAGTALGSDFLTDGIG